MSHRYLIHLLDHLLRHAQRHARQNARNRPCRAHLRAAIWDQVICLTFPGSVLLAYGIGWALARLF